MSSAQSCNASMALGTIPSASSEAEKQPGMSGKRTPNALSGSFSTIARYDFIFVACLFEPTGLLCDCARCAYRQILLGMRNDQHDIAFAEFVMGTSSGDQLEALRPQASHDLAAVSLHLNQLCAFIYTFLGENSSAFRQSASAGWNTSPSRAQPSARPVRRRCRCRTPSGSFRASGCGNGRRSARLRPCARS